MELFFESVITNYFCNIIGIRRRSGLMGDKIVGKPGSSFRDADDGKKEGRSCASTGSVRNMYTHIDI
jgi:hypothetical protein